MNSEHHTGRMPPKKKDPQVQGHAYLFTEQTGTSLLKLQLIRERKKPHSTSREYIDNPNLSIMPSNGTGTLAAWTRCSASRVKDDAREWHLCIVVFLHPQVTVVHNCRWESGKYKCCHQPILLKPMEKKISIRYLNKIGSSNISSHDDCIQCSTSGPDVPFQHRDLTDEAKVAFTTAKQTCAQLFLVSHDGIPLEHSKYTALENKDLKATFLNFSKGSKKKNQTRVKSKNRIRIRVNKQNSTVENGFAFPFIELPKCGPFVGRQNGKQKFAFLTQKDARVVLRKGKLPLEEYHSLITEYSKDIREFDQFTMDEHCDGLVFETTEDELGGEIDVQSEEEVVEPWETDGCVHSTWACGNALEFLDTECMMFILRDVFGNFGFSRSSTDCLGMNVYSGVKSALFVCP